MEFAANAVFVTAPTPTRAPRSPAPASGEERGFDDHLAEALPAEDAPPAEKPATAKSDAPDAEAAEAPLASAEAPNVESEPGADVAPTFVVQIVTPPAPPPVQAEPVAVPAADAAPVTPTDSAAPVDVPLDAQTGEAPSIDAKPRDAEAKTTPAPQPQQNADTAPQAQASGPAADAAAPLVSAPQAAPAPTPAPSPEVATQSAAATIAAPLSDTAKSTPASRETPIPRSDAIKPASKDVVVEGDTKTMATEAKAPAPQQTAARNAGPNANNAPIVQAPEAPAPTPASPSSTGAGLAAPVQHQAPAHQPIAAAEHGARVAPAASQVAREIVRRFDGETTRFEMRLDPPELGRIEVRLEVSRDHRVTAVVAADSPQALTELSRHARDLEAMLQSSGLELTDNGLSFDLRQGGEGDADLSDGSGERGSDANAEAETQPQAAARPLGYERWRGVRVDLMV